MFLTNQKNHDILAPFERALARVGANCLAGAANGLENDVLSTFTELVDIQEGDHQSVGEAST